MKKKAVGILITVMLLSVTGCGAQVQATNVQVEGSTVVASAVESEVIESTVVEETSSISENEVIEPVYIEREDLFIADNFYELDRERLDAVDMDSLEKTYEEYVLSESVDLYNFEGTWNGYSKPNIKVTLFGTNEDWAEVSFISTILYVPREDFDKVATKVTEVETESSKVILADTEEPKKETTTSKPKTETPVTSESVVGEPSTTEPIVEPEPVVVESNKYTPEEAVAVYRSIMEANGISWNPSIKEFASWGTGWIYLDKGEPEWAGNSAVESYKMGGGDATHPWTRYYLEVTGYDENAVYITEWHCR